LECTLAELPIGVAVRVVAVDPAAAERLAAHGFRPGAMLRVEQDAPFRGPRIVRLGAARIAIATTIARSVRVRRAAAPDQRP
jgi:Fe2+ transport system protein FeoA